VKVMPLTCKVCSKPIVLGQMSVEVRLLDGTIIVPVHSRTGEKKGKTCLEELKSVVETNDYAK
jgi:hypothetical protein